MDLVVLTPKNKVLFSGTKEECLEYIKEQKLTRLEFKLRENKGIYKL